MKNQRRDQVIDEAKRLIGGDRRNQYGDDTFQTLAVMWSAYLGVDVEPCEVCEMLALLKIARNRHQPKLDSYIDGIGYLALAAEEAFGNDT
jgi:hypothetical protein